MAKIFIGIHCTGWVTAHMTKWLLSQLVAQDIGPGKKIENLMIHIESGKPEDAAANQVMEAFLKTDCTHIMKMDNDIMADLHLINRLLDYDKDIVAAPITLVQDLGITFAGCNINDKDGTWQVPDIRPPNNTLVGPLDFVGGGCMLIKRNVIETLRKQGPIYVTKYGDQGQVTMYCDNYFLREAKKAGFEAYLDGTEVLGQVAEINLMQCITPGEWPRVKNQKDKN